MFGGKKEDRVIDRLLRAQARRHAASDCGCAGFDPDLGSAYLERILSAPEQRAYLQHLIECPNCRAAVARLSELGGPAGSCPYRDLPIVPGARTVSGADGRGWLAGLGSSILTPQWGLAAIAVLIGLILVPVLVVRNGRRNGVSRNQASVAKNSQAQTAGGTDSVIAQTGGDQIGSVAVANPAAGAPEKPANSNADSSDSGAAKKAEGANTGSASENLVAMAAPPAEAPASKAEPAESSESSDRESSSSDAAKQPTSSSLSGGKSEDERKSTNADQPAAASSVAATGAPHADNSRAKQTDRKDGNLPRIDPDKALRVSGDDEKTKVSVLKRGTQPDQPQPTKEKAATIKPQDSAPPPAESTQNGGMASGRRAIAGPPGKEFVSENKPTDDTHWNRDAAAAPSKLAKGERRVEGKKFRLINGIWTDRGFNPNKEMPSVTLVRDSDVYKALLEKDEALRGYLSGFASSERVIVVYKKIVYKLVPASAHN